jgi:hypothetical protein
MSEMLTEMVPGQEDSSNLELLQVRRTLAYGSAGLTTGLGCADSATAAHYDRT